MALGRPIPPVTPSPQTGKQLKSIVNSGCLPHILPRWAKIVVMAANGVSDKTITHKVGLSHATLRKPSGADCFAASKTC